MLGPRHYNNSNSDTVKLGDKEFCYDEQNIQSQMIITYINQPGYNESLS